MLIKLKNEINEHCDKKRAINYQRFFKTSKGDYGEGDIFIGVTVPILRKISKKYININFIDLQKLIKSKIHEHRLIALYLLVIKFNQGVKNNDDKQKKMVYDFYLNNLKYVNNWDLVDTSAHYIIGAYVFGNPTVKDILYDLAKSDDLWERRISMMSTFYFIKQGQFKDTLKISKILLNDDHDLIHKVVGWMLREIGKRDVQVEYKFLDKYYETMPRTMLRYAIEKFPEPIRKSYLNRK